MTWRALFAWSYWEETLVLTLAYDNKLRGYDSRTGTLWLVLENSNLCAFHAMEWEAEHRQVYLTDRYGYLWVWDLRLELVVYKEQLTGVATAGTGDLCSHKACQCVCVFKINELANGGHGPSRHYIQSSGQHGVI